MRKVPGPVVTSLYAFGSNGSGQLGVGHLEDLTSPQACRFLSNQADLTNESTNEPTDELRGSISQIVAGGNHTLVLKSDGMLYAAGNNVDGRCGIEPRFDIVMLFTPTQLPIQGKITFIAASWEASFVVEDTKRVYVVGSGSKGELGLGEDITQTSHMQLVFDVFEFDKEHHILTIAAGVNHVVVQLSNGRLIGWGNCRKGQLGDQHKGERVLWKPTVIELSFCVDQIVLGREYTLLLGDDNEHLLMGDTKCFDPLPHDFTSLVSCIQSGWSSIIYDERDRRVHGIGRNDRGQLPPRDVDTVTRFATGSEHTIAETWDGDLICWGWGEHGNCGSPIDSRGVVADRANSIQLTLKPGHNITTLFAGCATSFIGTTRRV